MRNRFMQTKRWVASYAVLAFCVVGAGCDVDSGVGIGNADGAIMLEGHADPSGSPDANQALSQSRADAVKDAIVSAGGDGSRIEVQAFGDTKLKYGRTDGRNRRVLVETK